ncbi:MAG: L-rhamnose mutarotase [Cyanobacteria bacterium]|nr:L-rhamnose mutarotase [Cyanobacteriota bacterium]
MEVICEMMRLKHENVKDYIELHNNTWPDLVKAIRESGFIEEYIYILDNLVIVIMKCENFENSSSKLSSTDIFKKWTAKVRAMLINDEAFFHTKDVLLDLKPIWRLDNFDDKGVLKF